MVVFSQSRATAPDPGPAFCAVGTDDEDDHPGVDTCAAPYCWGTPMKRSWPCPWRGPWWWLPDDGGPAVAGAGPGWNRPGPECGGPA